MEGPQTAEPFHWRVSSGSAHPENLKSRATPVRPPSQRREIADMDTYRVDEVTRAIAQGASRRTVLRALFGAAAVATAGRELPASAKSDKITMCKPTGSGYQLTDVNVKQVDKRLQDAYVEPPYSCENGPSCEECQSTCTAYHNPCSTDADCCSENCLDSGICGDLCYCFDRYDPDEQAALGPMCGGSTGTLCSSGQLPGCLSSADCDQSSSYTTCVVAPDCNASGGACAYPLFACEE
jgi:hypothetical protein